MYWHGWIGECVGGTCDRKEPIIQCSGNCRAFYGVSSRKSFHYGLEVGEVPWQGQYVDLDTGDWTDLGVRSIYSPSISLAYPTAKKFVEGSLWNVLSSFRTFEQRPFGDIQEPRGVLAPQTFGQKGVMVDFFANNGDVFAAWDSGDGLCVECGGKFQTCSECGYFERSSCEHCGTRLKLENDFNSELTPCFVVDGAKWNGEEIIQFNGAPLISRRVASRLQRLKCGPRVLGQAYLRTDNLSPRFVPLVKEIQSADIDLSNTEGILFVD